ncbi:outer envelope protein 64, chloroplastic [Euphorbia lathyris]|uniref:outer envelope protein 64, chloroplastic n=1 Tax=Euphorbia lathyris TaxID=212925 RepID=UPI0033130E2F
MSSNPANLWVLLGLGLAGILIITKRLKKAVREDFGAFVAKLQLLPPPQPAPPKAPHPLTGLTFAVSDIFDIEGYVTGFGHPDWAKTHDAASRTSSVVSALVEGGATCIGKTVVDELAYSINGENKHYGTPTNPAVPARVPGGSSSGAAVAVAANLVDFSLGVDTIGGVRLPAAFCGIIGFRPSYGIIPQVGNLPISASLDAVGWFAKDPSVMRRVGHMLLQLPFGVQRNPRQIIIADDCFQLLKIPVDRISQVVIKSAEKIFGRQFLKHENLEDIFLSKVPSLKQLHDKKMNGAVRTSSMRSLANIMQVLHRYEFRCNYAEWVNVEKPNLDHSISAQINENLEIQQSEIDIYKSIRNEMRAAINSLLKDDGILVIPTTACLPPKLGAKELLSEDYQISLFSLLSIATLSGCCQVTIPLGLYDKCPVSVSFIARHGGDRFLLDTMQSMYASLQEQADLYSKPKSLSNTDTRERSAEIAKEKGNQAFKNSQWQKAISQYTEAIKLNGNNATYYSNRAAAYLEFGSFLQAEADCAKAISLDKKNVKAYLRRGTAREMLGYYKEAIEDFQYALILEPNNRRAALSAERLRKVFP